MFRTSFEPSDPAPTWTDTVERAEGATMSTRIGGGPGRPYAAKPGVGFTGLRSLRYQGCGAGAVWHRIHAVELVVDADTELSYRIFPELSEGNPATWVAVDLAFADGTFLSELGARDQLGYPLTPDGQGASQALYPNQWNHRSSRIGEVAAGRTVARILVGYRNPDSAAPFAGWIDDIAVAARPAPVITRPSEYVITTRGTHSTGDFSRGNTFPATAVPHGFNFWTPLTNAAVTNWFYEYHKGNDGQNRSRLEAFGCSHLPSPWMGDRQTFQVMPTAASGVPDPGRSARSLAFSHDDEVARPHYYRVRFDDGITTEITPTDHAALFRFTFPGRDAGLIFDNVGAGGRLDIDTEAGVVTGYSDVRSGLSVGAARMFVHAEFDRPMVDASKLRRLFSSRRTGHVRFRPADQGGTVLTMRIATSLISMDQARRNLALEVSTSDTFDTVRERAQLAWDQLLGQVEVEGATPDQLVTLYSNLYRLHLYPNSAHENTGTAQQPVWRHASPVAPPAGTDTQTETGLSVVDGPMYVNNGFWDTYRTCWPAYALLTPTRCGEMIEGFLNQYREGGWVSRWSSPGYANLMTGTSSDVAFADAYLKGVTNFDVDTAYRAALRNATVTPPDDSVGRKGLARSIFLGWTPTSTKEGLSWTLEGCVNDFGIANLAAALGDRDNTDWFLDRSRHYQRSFDPSIGFFQGRDEAGRWRLTAEQYDPRVWGYDYVETDGWNTAFSAPHDGAGLAGLHGGRAGLESTLDTFFATPETATLRGSYGKVIHEMTEARDVRLGQYGHSNQPSHHIAYMYAYAGAQHKTAAIVREVLARAYSGSEIGQGYPGDEDNGEMSAWWVFSALGFYPLQVGSPRYVIGSPLFPRATVHLENGNDLVVIAHGNSGENVYVQSLLVDGEPYERCHLPHELLVSGATLEFTMGPTPSGWGTGEDALPWSPPAERPLTDVTTGQPGVLFDDTTATELSLPGPSPAIRCRLTEPVRVLRYTLTSGASGPDPSDWVLAGSNDALSWVTLDQRSGQTFSWRRQTRAFTVADPGDYREYRVQFTGTNLVVAQLELLA